MDGVFLSYFTPKGLFDVAKHPTRIESTYHLCDNLEYRNKIAKHVQYINNGDVSDNVLCCRVLHSAVIKKYMVCRSFPLIVLKLSFP